MLDSASRNRLFGVTAVGMLVAASVVGIVRAEGLHPDNSGLFRCSSGRACVEGNSTARATLGVLGISTGEGIEGVTFSEVGKAGVRGASRGTSGIGYGVIGSSINGDGVVGIAHGSRDIGVRGRSDKGDGILAESKGANSVALRAEAELPHTAIFFGGNRVTAGHCLIDHDANLSCTGNIMADSGVASGHRNARGQRVLAYASESTTPTIDDVGSARLVNGIANVPIAPDFGALIDPRSYFVFLTPLGETRGLYVSRKTASGFQVRELAHGNGSVNFDYRIVAHPMGASTTRLPATSP